MKTCGFAELAGRRRRGVADLRDLLHVVGWNDKAFRYLATHATLVDNRADNEATEFEQVCKFRGRLLTLQEDDHALTVREGRTIGRSGCGLGRRPQAGRERWRYWFWRVLGITVC